MVEVVEESTESDDEVRGIDTDRAGEICFGADLPGRRGIQSSSSGGLMDMSAHGAHNTYSFLNFLSSELMKGVAEPQSRKESGGTLTFLT